MIEVQFFRVGQILPGLSSLGQSWTYLVGPWHVHELNHIFIICKPCKTPMHSCGILCKTTVDVLPKTCVPTPYIHLVCYPVQFTDESFCGKDDRKYYFTKATKICRTWNYMGNRGPRPLLMLCYDIYEVINFVWIIALV